ncbi:MAG TPA: hypothetical protein VGK73_12070 [Polyangiaceae bacterium]
MPLTFRSFVVLSVTLHAGMGVLAAWRGEARPNDVPAMPDRWAGHGVEVDALSATEAAELAAAPATAVAPAEAPEPAAEAGPAPPPSQAPEVQPPAREEGTRTDPRPPAPLAQAPAVAKPARPSRPPRRTKTAPSAEPAGGTQPGELATAPGGAGSSAPVESSYGASGLPPGVRHLPNAFTRALAIANRADRRWRDLPLGRAGEAHLRLAVNEAGELGELEFPKEGEREALAPVVRHLLDNTRLLLQAGRFSLDPQRLSAGVARLRVMVELTEREGANPEGDPGELFGVAWEAPRRDKPGKSGFVLNSGRQVTAWVWIE